MRETRTFYKAMAKVGPSPEHSYRADAYTEDGGLTWKWTTNDRYCPLDACKEYNIPCNVEAQRQAEKEEFRKFVEQYRKSYNGPTPEERAEARAAHGPGVTLANAITGDKWTT